MSETLRLATRGSALALRQAESVREALGSRRRPVDLVEVETRGDRITDELIHRLGRTGAFVRALDEQVVAGDVDAAVHSMKDMPTELPDELVVAGVPERASPADVLVTVDGRPLDDLPSGATVGTSSLRRKAQLLAERPDLDVQPLRGNVDTRAEKLLAPGLQREHERRLDAEESAERGSAETSNGEGSDPRDADGADDDATAESFEADLDSWFNGLNELQRRALERDVETEYDAIVLAEAGLDRSGLAHSLEYRRLSPSQFVPAPGQGTIAVTARDGETAERVHSALDHPPSRVRATVERTILAELGGGCVAPVGIYARLQGAQVNVVVRVLSRDGTEEIRESRDLPVDRHPEAAREFATALAERGAADLVERARRESQPERGAREDDTDESHEADASSASVAVPDDTDDTDEATEDTGGSTGDDADAPAEDADGSAPDGESHAPATGESTEDADGAATDTDEEDGADAGEAASDHSPSTPWPTVGDDDGGAE
jgi:hydroxymethylbilane synthase